MSVVHEGTLKGAFKGFKNRETVFEFTDGTAWRQNEHKYNYSYAYMPHARIVQRDAAYYIEVDGLADSVQVVRIR